jgi:hypothetical protein
MKSKFIWDRLAILQFIQFPWRWLTIASLFIAVLTALSTTFIKSRFWRYSYALLLLILILFNSIYFKPEKYLDDASSLYYSDSQLIQKEMSGVLPDYIPAQMANNETLKSAALNKDIVWSNDKNSSALQYHLKIDRSHEKLFIFELNQDTLLNFKIAYFPGWRAEINGEPTEIIVNPEIGNIQIQLPKGNSQLGLYFSEQTLPRLLGNWISFFGLVIFFLCFSPFLEEKNRSKSKTEN